MTSQRSSGLGSESRAGTLAAKAHGILSEALVPLLCIDALDGASPLDSSRGRATDRRSACCGFESRSNGKGVTTPGVRLPIAVLADHTTTAKCPGTTALA